MTNQTPTNSINLWNTSITCNTYGTVELYYQHLFEQYKIFVEMADKISARRDSLNTYFLTLNTLIVGAIGFMYEKGPNLFATKWVIIFPLLGILFLCYLWWRLVKSYRQLNTAKYKVIGEFEKLLPASPYWNAEWRLLGEGNDKKLYQPLTDLEYWLPITFGLIYIIGAAAIFFL